MSLAIDIAVLVLLVGTLAYAWLVDRRVRRLMHALREVEPLIGSFSQAVDRSESTVSALRAVRDAQGATPKEAGDERAEPAFRSKRGATPRSERASISGKSELIRGFFDTVRQREA